MSQENLRSIVGNPDRYGNQNWDNFHNSMGPEHLEQAYTKQPFLDGE